MRRHIAIMLILGLIFGAALAPVAEAAKRKKKKKPVPVDLIYYIVWDGEGCALSTTTEMASEEDACADPFAGLTGPVLGSGPWGMPAVDGIPLTLDASKPVKGKISVDSFYLVGAGPDVMGIGEAQVEVKLAGAAAGEEVVLGEVTTEPYLVTPASSEYEVEFEIQPPEELNGTVLDELTLTMEITGTQMFHGVFPADGTSTLTIGAFALK